MPPNVSFVLHLIFNVKVGHLCPIMHVRQVTLFSTSKVITTITMAIIRQLSPDTSVSCLSQQQNVVTKKRTRLLLIGLPERRETRSRRMYSPELIKSSSSLHFSYSLLIYKCLVFINIQWNSKSDIKAI